MTFPFPAARRRVQNWLTGTSAGVAPMPLLAVAGRSTEPAAAALWLAPAPRK